ncbi:MAG: radical SAM family heme chaperone HemW [Lachnospiraceae bacterium]|nr:radical SAM family heme chaperone HemW [Lachnospiraceae bacterium]
MELYVHIPFCARKCRYCDFLSFPAGEELKERYIDALCSELNSLYGLHDVSTCFIGGGTPSIVPARLMEKLLHTISRIGVKGEYTVECNPGTVDAEKLKLYREYGINRISFGLESADDEELEKLGRIHVFDDFLRSYELAGKCGFDNINIDLMSGLPGQTLKSLEKTLKTAAGLGPKHISVYSLIIEEGTPFYDLYGKNDELLPDEDTEREMYHMTGELFSEYGFRRYEISNYALKGYECVHNLGYWTGEEYTGTGIGAASYLKNGENGFARYKNPDDISRYISICADKKEHAAEELRTQVETLAEKDLVSEYIILHLRLTEGFDRREFRTAFGFDIYERFGKILDKYLNMGLLETDGTRIRLSLKGLDVANTVMADFL